MKRNRISGLLLAAVAGLLFAACGGGGGGEAAVAAGSGGVSVSSQAASSSAGVSSGSSASSSAAATSSSTSSVATGTWVSGKATFYGATGEGNCSFDASPGDLDVAAMNQTEYDGSNICGAAVEVVGPKGTVTVRITDRCPECGPSHIDLSEQAFAKVGNPVDGIIPITWRVVPRQVQGPVSYRIKEGSSQWWTAIQVRNHRYPIASLEVRGAGTGGNWQRLPRQMYNHFLLESGVGAGSFQVRITASNGAVLTDSIPSPEGDRIHAGQAQFP